MGFWKPKLVLEKIVLLLRYTIVCLNSLVSVLIRCIFLIINISYFVPIYSLLPKSTESNKYNRIIIFQISCTYTNNHYMFKCEISSKNYLYTGLSPFELPPVWQSISRYTIYPKYFWLLWGWHHHAITVYPN